MYVQEDFQLHYLRFESIDVSLYLYTYEMLFIFICKFTITY